MPWHLKIVVQLKSVKNWHNVSLPEIPELTEAK